MGERSGYVKASGFDRTRQRHNHRVFLLALKRKPALAATLVFLFMALGVSLVSVNSLGSLKFWHPAMAWIPAVVAIGVAAYLTAAIYLVQDEDRDGMENGSSGESKVRDVGGETENRCLLTAEVSGPVLMLDIDGVLHCGQSGRLTKLRLLQAWLRENPSVQVVISSDWRYTHGMDEVRSLFDVDLQPRVIGATPIREGAPREVEVLELVDQCGIGVWATLDDVPEGFPTTADRLVKTNPLFGLDEADLAELSKRLGLDV